MYRPENLYYPLERFGEAKENRSPEQANADWIWWALVDDFRILPLGQIVAGVPRIGAPSMV